MPNKHVVPNGKSWSVKTPGITKPASNHRTQGAAQKAAKAGVRRGGGGEVVIPGKNDRIRDSDTVAPGHDPFPPRDSQH